MGYIDHLKPEVSAMTRVPRTAPTGLAAAPDGGPVRGMGTRGRRQAETGPSRAGAAAVNNP